MKFIPPPKRVANKIILLVIVLELVSISIWGTLTYKGSEKELLKSITSQLKEVSFRTSSEIDNFFVPIQIETKLLANLVSNQQITSKQQNLLLHRLIKARPEIEEISLVDHSGIETQRISRLHGYTKEDFRVFSKSNPIFKLTKNQQDFSDIYFSRYNEPQIHIITAIPDANSNTHTTLLTLLNLKWLWDTVFENKIGETGYIYIVDNNKKLIAHPDPSLVISAINIDRSNLPNSLFEKSTTTKLTRYKSLTGDDVTGVSYYSQKHNWWIIVEQPIKEGLAPLSRLIDRFIFAFIMAIIFSIIIVVVFSRRTMKPLQTLEAAISNLANGKRDIRIEIPKHTELADLAIGFNSMAEKLDEKIAGLIRSEKNLQNSELALNKSEKSVRLLLDSTAESILGFDLKGYCTFCNPAALKQLGYHKKEYVLNRQLRELLLPRAYNDEKLEYLECDFCDIQKITTGIHKKDILLTKSNGDTFHSECWIHPIVEDGVISGIVFSSIDITERHSHIKELEYQATHDALTSLPNRKFLHQELQKNIDLYSSEAKPFSLFLLDLDRFKEVNDTLGHKSGDNVLKQIKRRLTKLLAPGDFLARLGGDEFAICLTSITEIDKITDFARSIRTAVQVSFILDGLRIQIDVSTGIALFPLHGTDDSTLLRRADIAMYQAKNTGSGFAIYNHKEDENSVMKLSLMGDLHKAINNNELVLFYQPKITTDDLSIIGFEALIRWNHPEHGLLPPNQFLGIAEVSVLIKPLTLWVIEQAIKDLQIWQENSLLSSVAVNISARNIQDRDFKNSALALFDKYKLATNRIQMEITESAIMSDPEGSLQTIEALNKAGVMFSIDDFGTGYSSLAYLKNLPVSELKIDKSFVIDMELEGNDAKIVHSTIDLAHNMGMQVTAEGIENDNTLKLLTQLNCDFLQGFHISKAMPADKVIDWVQAWNLKNNISN